MKLIDACKLVLKALEESHMADGSLIWASPGSTAIETLRNAIEDAEVAEESPLLSHERFRSLEMDGDRFEIWYYKGPNEGSLKDAYVSGRTLDEVLENWARVVIEFKRLETA